MYVKTTSKVNSVSLSQQQQPRKIHSREYPMKNYLTKDKYPAQNHPTSYERDINIKKTMFNFK